MALPSPSAAHLVVVPTTPTAPPRYDRDSNPEAFPATTDEFAAPLPKDNKEVAQLRRLLARTSLETMPLKIAYDGESSPSSP